MAGEACRQSHAVEEGRIVPQTVNQTGAIVLDPMHASFGPDARIEDLGAVHFIGIGGAGMSVLAEMLHAQGVPVDGSDREASAKTERLEELGIRVEIGQRADNVTGADTVVWSSAIKPDNPEIVAAMAAGARLVHRSDILALLMVGRRAVTVAGAHGKTTTSSMLSHILVHAGQGAAADPSYAIGGAIQGPDGTTLDGGHAGTGDVLVAEADESDGSFLKYHPSIAIITNAEPDHLDHYGDAERYHAAFAEYASHVTGHVIVCADDQDARDVLAALPAEVASRVIAYGTSDPDALKLALPQIAVYVRIEGESEAASSGRERFALTRNGERLDVALAVPGLHNARNAAAALIAATLLGLDPARAAEAAGGFLGAARRFQVLGEVKGVTVVDDYAHHPTEIAALLAAARRRYPAARLRVLFQPHLFSRTQVFAFQFAQALSAADDVIVTGIFPARERQEDFPGVDAGTIVRAADGLKESGAASEGNSEDSDEWIHAVGDMETAARMMAMRAHRGDVVMTVGAGDITAMGPVILAALEAHRESCA